MIDIHSHLLPGTDHGALNEKDSALHLETAKQYGVAKIIATPHFYYRKNDIDSFLEMRDAAYLRLNHINQTGIEIRKGAEVAILPGLSELQGLHNLCIENTRTLLIEMPFTKWDNLIYNEISILLSKDYDIIAAHIDRYPFDEVKRLMNFDVKGQINAYSLFSMNSVIKTIKCLNDGFVSYIASDAHVYNLKKAYKALKFSKLMVGKRNFKRCMDNSESLFA